jgi:hypothetical protein
LRIKWLLENLGLVPQGVAASNLIFPRSRDAASSRFFELSKICWPVDADILDIVRPQPVIVYGNSGLSPYKFLFDKFEADSEECEPSGHGAWLCRSFIVPGRFRVVGVPHMSRYKISAHDSVVNWVKEAVEADACSLTSKWSRRAPRRVPSCRDGARLVWRVRQARWYPFGETTGLDFSTRMRALEEEFAAAAAVDDDVYLPNFTPTGPVDAVLIGMEPSLGWWARTPETAAPKIAGGFRNFMWSPEDFILHYSARRSLCSAGGTYHITDISKGAMTVEKARIDRRARYAR